MSGGTFQQGEEKTRPGIYFNFKSAAANRIAVAARGTVTLPLILNWGSEKTFLKIEAQTDAMELLGYDYNDPEMLMIREAKKRARTVLVYKLNVGTKSTGTFGTTAVCTVTAKHGGTRGNDIQVVSSTNILDEAKKDVKTFVNGQEVDSQTAATIEELVANNWVVFSGTGTIEATAGVTLSGGDNGTVVNADYTDYLSATETQFFDVIGYPVDDPTLKTSFVTFIKRMRDEEGKKIKGVVSGHAADYEGIVNVGNGVILLDGTALTAKEAVAWVAGAEAGASITQSNTYQEYEGAMDANPRMTSTEITAALKRGEFIFVHDGEKVKVEQDINSLVTYTPTKNKRFSKNRVVRVLDAINNDVTREFKNSYVGKIDNDPDGQALLADAIAAYFQILANARAIRNYNRETDIFIDPVNSVGDAVYGTLGADPTDSGEKFYFNVGVK